MTDNCEKDQCTAFHQEYKDICNDYVASSMLESFKKVALAKGEIAVLDYCKNAINCNDCTHKIGDSLCSCQIIIKIFKIVYSAFVKDVNNNPKEYEEYK